MFRFLTSETLPPFGRLRLELPTVENKSSHLAEVHLLTGINGTGKSRLLSVMAAILGQSAPLLRRCRGHEGQFNVRWLTTKQSPIPHESSWPLLHYSNGSCVLHQGGPSEQWAQSVPAFAYSGIPYITDAAVAVMADLAKPARSDCLLFTRPEQQSNSLLQAIANLKMQAAMDTQSVMDEMPATSSQIAPSHAIRIARALENTITSITGKRFIFSTTSYPKVSLGVNWGGKRMAFDGLPDGLRSILGWLAHAVVMMDALLAGRISPLDSEAVFLLDEIEIALHPAWQRKILPAFQHLFPKAQIIIATHSPFVIASLNHG